MLPARGTPRGLQQPGEAPGLVLGEGVQPWKPPQSSEGCHSPAQLFPHLIEVLHTLLPEGGHGCGALAELKPPLTLPVKEDTRGAAGDQHLWHQKRGFMLREPHADTSTRWPPLKARTRRRDPIPSEGKGTGRQ